MKEILSFMIELVGFEPDFQTEKISHRLGKQDGGVFLKTITYLTTYYVVNMVLTNIWPIKYENRKP